MRWRRYGPVAISAGLFVTGVGLWLFRGGVRGELQAECVAGLYERDVWARWTGTGDPPPALEGFLTLTNETYVTNFYAEVEVVLDSESGGAGYCLPSTNRVRFTPDNWGAGQIVTFSMAAGAPSNYASYWDLAIEGERDSGGLIQMRRGSSSSGALIYEGEQIYAFHRVNYLTPGGTRELNIRLLAPPSETYEVITNRAAAGPIAVDDYLRWQHVYAMLAGLRRAATGAGASIMWVRRRCAEWQDGDVVAFAGRPWQVYAGTEEDIGTGGETHSNTAWEASGPTGVYDNVAAFGVRWPWPGATWAAGLNGTNAPFLAAAAEGLGLSSATGQPGQAVLERGGWWQACGFGGTGYAWRCEHATPTGYQAVARWISTNLYSDARCALTQMVTTVWVGDLWECENTGVVTRTWSSNHAETVTGEGYTEDDGRTEWAGFVLDDAHAALGVTTSTVEGAVLAWAAADLEASLACDTYLPDENWESEITRTAAIEKGAVRAGGVAAPHPSEAACATGLVARVRVFAILAAESLPVGQGYSDSWWANSDEYPVTFEGGRSQGAASGLGLVTRPETNGPAWPATRYASTRVDYRAATTAYRLQLLGDWESPSTRPRWAIGADAVPLAYADATPWAVQDWSKDTLIDPDPPSLGYHLYERRWTANHSERVVCHGIVVVTDWAFRHTGEGAQYAPETYTPEWARTNAP